jgi:hypothetical protein
LFLLTILTPPPPLQSLGHGEVVGMTIPQSKIGDFSQLYFSLFNPKTKGVSNIHIIVVLQLVVSLSESHDLFSHQLLIGRSGGSSRPWW